MTLFRPFLVLGMLLLAAGCASEQTLIEPPSKSMLGEQNYETSPALNLNSKSPDSTGGATRSDTLTFSDALSAALLENPNLQSYGWQLRVREAQRIQAALPPKPELEAEMENFGGTGPFEGYGNREINIRLAQKILLGADRLKRKRLAGSNKKLAGWDYETQRLNVLTGVTKAYISALEAQRQWQQQQELVGVAENLFESVSAQVKAGKVSKLAQTKANVELSRAKLNASVEALRLYGLSQSSIQNIEAESDQPLSYFELKSPLTGVIQERHISPGETIGPNETPIHVANLSKMWVMIDAYEQDIPYLESGQQVSISIRSIPGQTFQGITDWISYSLEENTRTMPVRAIVDNPGHKLRAGMFGTARITTGGERNVAMIPVDAVQTIEEESVVFVPGQEDGSYRPIDVILGSENEGYVEIASGLQPGEQAVIAGAFDLKSALTAQTRSASHGH